MFCYQCEQRAKGEGSTHIEVCGKQPEVVSLQDLLVHALKGLALYAVEGCKHEIMEEFFLYLFLSYKDGIVKN